MVNENKTYKKGKEKIAVITYNRVGGGSYENGWSKYPGHQVFILQNHHKSKWLVQGGSTSLKEKVKVSTMEEMLGEIKPLLGKFNHIYLYVGKDCAEEGIKLTKEMPADKVTYVMCSCDNYKKKEAIERLGHEDSRIINCECGGHSTLEDIVRSGGD